MLDKVVTIAGNAFRETVRQPVFCVTVGVAAALIALSPTFTMFTLMESVKLIQDMGLSTLLLAGLLLAVLSASTVVTEEVRGRTALMVVARPIGRGEFLLGKFLGIALAQLVAAYLLTLVLVLTVRVGAPETATTELDTNVIWSMLAAIALTLVAAAGSNYFFDKPFSSAVVAAGLLFFTAVFVTFCFFDIHLKPVPFLSSMNVETLRACVVLYPMIMLLTAAAVACATRLSLVTSVVVCSLFFVVGIVSDYVFGQFAAKSLLAAAPYVVLPSFQVFWMGDALAAERAIPWAYVAMVMGYGVLYTAALLFFGMLLFETREIT